jgi:hypothetical protein
MPDPRAAARVRRHPVRSRQIQIEECSQHQADVFSDSAAREHIYQSSDPNEQSSLRHTILRQALSEEYLADLGKRFGLFRHADGDIRQLGEIAELLKRIEYFSVDSTSYQIGVVANRADLALAMTKDVLTQMMSTLILERERTLKSMRDAIQQRIKLLAPGIMETPVPVSALERDNLRKELVRLQAQMAILRSQYTERHPEVLRLEERERLLRGMLREPVAPASGAAGDDETGSPASKTAKQDVLDELTRNLNNITMVLDSERDRGNIRYLAIVERPSLPLGPFFPPREVFLLMGFIGGLVLAVVAVTYKELARGTFLAPEHLAQSLNVPLLGELPLLGGSKRLQLPSAPGAEAIRHQLPAPPLEG